MFSALSARRALFLCPGQTQNKPRETGSLEQAFHHIWFRRHISLKRMIQHLLSLFSQSKAANAPATRQDVACSSDELGVCFGGNDTTILVRSGYHKFWTIDCCECDSVLDVKKRIALKLNVPVEEQDLRTKVPVLDGVAVGVEGKGVWWGRWGVRNENEDGGGIRFEERLLDDTMQNPQPLYKGNGFLTTDFGGCHQLSCRSPNPLIWLVVYLQARSAVLTWLLPLVYPKHWKVTFSLIGELGMVELKSRTAPRLCNELKPQDQHFFSTRATGQEQQKDPEEEEVEGWLLVEARWSLSGEIERACNEAVALPLKLAKHVHNVCLRRLRA